MIEFGFANVDEHVSVGEFFKCASLSPLLRRDQAVEHVASKVVLGDLLVRDRSDAIIIEFEPSFVLGRLNEGKVMASVQVARVYEHAVELVDEWLGAFGGGINKLVEVNGEWELEAIVDLASAESTVETHLAHSILLNVIFEPPELKMQNGWELCKDDTLFANLKTVGRTGVDLVVAIHSLNHHVLLERIIKTLDALDGKLDVYQGRQLTARTEFARRTIELLYTRRFVASLFTLDETLGLS